MSFGNGLSSQTTGALLFAAGPNDEVSGLYGRIEPAPGKPGSDRDDGDDCYALYPDTASLPSARTLTLSVSLCVLWVAAALLGPAVGVASKPGLLSPSLVFAAAGIPGSMFPLPELSAFTLTGFRSAAALVGHLRLGLAGCTAGGVIVGTASMPVAVDDETSSVRNCHEPCCRLCLRPDDELRSRPGWATAGRLAMWSDGERLAEALGRTRRRLAQASDIIEAAMTDRYAFAARLTIGHVR